MATRKISVEEVSTHSSSEDGWIVINNTVWDVTEFAPTHPGGAEIISEYLGQDASAAYNEVHGPGIVAKYLDKSCLKGQLDLSTVTEAWKSKQASNVESQQTAKGGDKPPLEAIINLYDFEEAAQKTLSAKSWAFYSAAANDCLTKDANADWWRKIWFRPRVLAGVKQVDCSATVLGEKFALPVFSAPAALGKLAHPDGELALARGAVAKGTTICACHNASYPIGDIRGAMPADHPIFYQLYVNKDRAVTEALLREVVALRPRALLVTVDLPVVGKREADERVKIDAAHAAGKLAPNVDIARRDGKGSGLARATGSFIDADLRWADLAWLRSLLPPALPLFAKGIQTASDARRAMDAGCAGIYISNHGGRAVDTAQPSLLTLLELNADAPDVLARLEVWIDGGIRRGTDVLKAVCLGASAVCLGRPFLFALGYGQEGVEHAIDSA